MERDFGRRDRIVTRRLDRASSVAAPAALGVSARAITRGRSAKPIDLFDVGVLTVFAAISTWVVALNLYFAARNELVWTGVDGVFPVDQMQYLAWVQDSARHVLVSDLFAAGAAPHDYLQPMVAISGRLAALGLPAWLALLVWKPVGVTAIFLAVRAQSRRLFASRGPQRAAVVLGLFAAWYGTLGDEWLPFMSWGYLFGLVAVAALVGALVSYDRCCWRQRFSVVPGGLGLLAAWVHPWQGEILVLIIFGVELQRRLSRRAGFGGGSLRLLLVTASATALPLAYYALLQHYDPAWRMAATVVQHQAGLPRILLPLSVLAVAALPAYFGPPSSFLSSAIRLWPPAALAVWGLASAGWGTGPLHAWTGITVPLGALAVQGVRAFDLRRLPGSRYLALAAIVAVTIPGGVLLMGSASHFVTPARHNQNLMTVSESRALGYLSRDPHPGRVLSTYYLGDAVPGETGRWTYAGDYRWSGPAYRTREQKAWELLNGWIRGRAARAFVVRTGARFIVSDCTSRADLRPVLAPLLLSVRRFGCAVVYELK